MKEETNLKGYVFWYLGKYMKDQRQFVRKSINANVSLFSSETAKFLGNLVDYSDSGIMISSYGPVEAEQTFHFTIVDLPNNIGRKRTGRIQVQSVWCSRINDTLYGTGFKLIESDEQAQIMFKSYDDWLSIPESS